MRRHAHRERHRAEPASDPRGQAQPADHLGEPGQPDQALGVLGQICDGLRRQGLLRERQKGLGQRLGRARQRLGVAHRLDTVDDEEAGQHGAGRETQQTHGLCLAPSGLLSKHLRATLTPMCGRYASSADTDWLEEVFEIDETPDPLPGPRYNIAPTDPVVAVVERVPKDAPERVVRKLVELRWGH